MADIFQPILSGVKAEPHVSKGVQDNSMVGLLGDAAKMGIEAYTGYQMADLEKEMTKEADSYFNTNAPGYLSNEAKALGAEVGGLVKGEQEFLLSGIPSPDEQEQYTRGLSEKLSTYQNAVAQGRMSLDQLQTRILSATREAVNRNPFLQKELLQTADKYMELSGLGSFMKQQAKLEKDQGEAYQKMVSDLDAEGREKDIPGWFSMSVEQKMQSIDAVRRQERTVKEAEAITKTGQFIDRNTYLQWRDGGKLSDYHNGMLGQLNVKMQALFRNNPTAGYSATQYSIRQILEEAKMAYPNSIPLNIRNEPEVKQQIEDFRKFADQMEANLSKLGSGEDMAKAVGNQVAIMKGMQEKDLRSRVNPEQFDMLAKLKMADPSGVILGEGNLKAIDDFLSNTFNAMFKTPAFQRNIPTVQQPNDLSSKAIAAGVASAKKDQDWKPFKEIIAGYNKAFPEITDSKSKNLFITQNLREIAKSDLTGLDSEGILGVQKMISDYMDDKAFGLKSMFQNVAKSQYDVQMDILEDGRLVFTGKDAEAFNGAYGKNINTALEAYAKANGMTIKAASAGFYETYFGKYKEAQPLVEEAGGARWEARTPEEAFKLYDAGTIDEPTYRTIVRDMLGKQEQGSNLNIQPTDNTIPTLSPEAKERLPIPQPAPQQSGISPEFARELRNPQPKQQVDVREQSRKILMDSVRVALDSTGFKSSPLLKKSSKEDAIESISYIEALHDIPGAGPAIEAALIAFGLTNAIPTLAKKLPRMFAGGKVVAPTSNISVAGGSSGASKAIAQGALNEAKQMKQEQIKELYQQYWKKEWIKQHINLPKSDLEWSNAIAQANKWVETRIKNPPLKSMEKK